MENLNKQNENHKEENLKLKTQMDLLQKTNTNIKQNQENQQKQINKHTKTTKEQKSESTKYTENITILLEQKEVTTEHIDFYDKQTVEDKKYIDTINLTCKRFSTDIKKNIQSS